MARDEARAQRRRKRGDAPRLGAVGGAAAQLRVHRFDERLEDRDAGREHGRLGDDGVVETLCGAAEARTREIETERAVRFLEHLTRAGGALVDRAAHADGLRALPGEHEGETSHGAPRYRPARRWSREKDAVLYSAAGASPTLALQ